MAKNRIKLHTASRIKKNLSHIPHARQRLQRIQPLLDDDPQGAPLVLVFSVDELGIVEQPRILLVGRIRLESHILSKQNFREVVDGPSVSLLRPFDRFAHQLVLRNPPRTGPADLHHQIDFLQLRRHRVKDRRRPSGQRWLVRDHLAVFQREWLRRLISSKHQLVSFLYPRRLGKQRRLGQPLVVVEQLAVPEIVQDPVVAERKSAEGDHDRDEPVQPLHTIRCRKGDCGRHEDDRMVCVVELDPIAVDEPDGRVRTEGGDRELLKEVSSDLEICVLLLFCLSRLGSPCGDLTAGIAWGRRMVRLSYLPARFGGLVRRPLEGWSRFRGRGSLFFGTRCVFIGWLLRVSRRRASMRMVLLWISSYPRLV